MFHEQIPFSLDVVRCLDQMSDVQSWMAFVTKLLELGWLVVSTNLQNVDPPRVRLDVHSQLQATRPHLTFRASLIISSN